jgi:hypothetical protein
VGVIILRSSIIYEVPDEIVPAEAVSVIDVSEPTADTSYQVVIAAASVDPNPILHPTGTSTTFSASSVPVPQLYLLYVLHSLLANHELYGR